MVCICFIDLINKEISTGPSSTCTSPTSKVKYLSYFNPFIILISRTSALDLNIIIDSNQIFNMSNKLIITTGKFVIVAGGVKYGFTQRGKIKN